MRKTIISFMTMFLISVACPAWCAQSKAEQFSSLAATLPAAEALILGDSIVMGISPLGNTAIAGVSGSGVRTWTQHADKIVKKVRPKYILIVLGVNDAAPNADIEIWAKRYEALCTILSQGGAKVIVSTILPVRPKTAGVSPSAIRQMNERIVALSKSRGYGFVDSWKAMSDVNGHLVPEYAAPDGIHLNPSGYARWMMFLYEGK